MTKNSSGRTRVRHSVADARGMLAELRAGGGSIGSIHTLGALHAGHGQLIEIAAAENDHVVVTVYPNKAQLAPDARYEHDLDRDVRFAIKHGATHVITSSDAEMYPADYRTFLDQGEIMKRLDGTVLPFLFRGMITMCIRWIALVRPNRSYWGLKDIGQLLLVRRAVADLLIETEIREVPCVRYRSGVPVSSRLLLLDHASLVEVRQVYRAIEAGRQLAAKGERRTQTVVNRVRAVLESHPFVRFQVKYIRLANATDFTEPAHVGLPFIIHVALTDGSIFHFDGCLIRTPEELADGAPTLWLEDEWP